jgi:translation initiation factor 5B
MIRSPIVAILAHVDHGKTTLLDRIRNTSIAAGEAGGITQSIGATTVPRAVIEELCGERLAKMGIKLTIPGMLFIDTPGHEAFTNLRKRGGSIADLAVLLVDINQGIQAQTDESIEILKLHKVPFIIAANKIDMLYGWQANDGESFASTFAKQAESVKKDLDAKVYQLIGDFYKRGFNCERFDRVEDFTKQVVIVPTSGRSGEGVAELLMFIAGLTQRFMEKQLETADGPAKGTVLEVKEEQGLGTTIDTIIYEGKLSVGDMIVVGGKNAPIVAKVRALLQPKPLEEMRDPKKKFSHVDTVYASAGVKINAPGLEETLAGSSLYVVSSDKEKDCACEAVANELKEASISKDTNGAVIKTDSIGSLEALAKLLAKAGIPIKSAAVGHVTKKDVIDAEAVRDKGSLLGVVFAFNTEVLEDARKEAQDIGIKIFETKVVYQFIEDYQEWAEAERKREHDEMLKSPLFPVKFRVLPGFMFRQSKPAIFGVEILDGVLKTPCPLMNKKGIRCGKVKSMQKDRKNIEKAEAGEEVAVSVEGVTMGRQVNEGDTLLTNIPLKEIPRLEKELKEHAALLQEIKKIKKENKESEME